MLKNNRNYKISSLIILSIFFDQLSKFWIRSNIESYNEIELIGSFFTLIRVENSGAFLGMGSELSYIPKLILLIIFPILVLVAVSIYTFVDKKLDNLSLVGFSLIIGGGIANIFDRIVYGSVTDFLYINLGGFLKTGIFNIADFSVTTGMILILIASFKKAN